MHSEKKLPEWQKLGVEFLLATLIQPTNKIKPRKWYLNLSNGNLNLLCNSNTSSIIIMSL